MTNLIEIRNVSKYFGGVAALKAVSFAVAAGEVGRPDGRERGRQIHARVSAGGHRATR